LLNFQGFGGVKRRIKTGTTESEQN
jgi:hypothetical protein